jgi:hypothetical protein
MMRPFHLRVALIIPTSMNVIEASINAREDCADKTKGLLSVACHSRPASCRAQRLEVAAHPSLA